MSLADFHATNILLYNIVNVVFGLCKEFIVKEFAVASCTPNRKSFQFC